MHSRRSVTLALVLAATLIGSATVARSPVWAQGDGPPVDGRTPPRLSYVDGQVSFWRPGAPDWVAAQINTPLSPGDEVSTGSPGNAELQIGPRAFIRGWADSSLGVVNQDPEYLQLKVTAGYVSLDLRALEPGRIVEVDTPNAAFTIDHAGYYRVDVSGNRTSFISRRGGRATVTPASGQAAAIAPSEEIVIDGVDAPAIATYVAPPLDDWDRWNYARTDYLAEAVSARYVSPGMYGVSDLDRYGRWRVVSEYGPIWVPIAVPAGWVPYSTGSWTWDPYYDWTWIDAAPWGWAPFHYGRWVFIDGFWAWAPGPVVVRAVYAPALVAFFGGGPGVAVRVGGPLVGWVALGWGEPVIPWWGGPRFVGTAWWGGWGGPRVVNNVVINRTTVVNVQEINVYRNTTVQHAVVAVDHQRFGQGRVTQERVTRADVSALHPVRGPLEIKPAPASLVPSSARGVRPPEERLARPVVATRPPQASAVAPPVVETKRAPAVVPPPKLVPAPQGANAAVVSPRPPFGRGQSERPQPPPPPQFKGALPRTPDTVAPQRQSTAPPVRDTNVPRAVAAPTPRPEQRATPPTRAPEGQAPRLAPAPPQAQPAKSAPPVARERAATPGPPATPQAPPPRVAGPPGPARPLPGEAANRLSPGRSEGRPPVARPTPPPKGQGDGHPPGKGHQ